MKENETIKIVGVLGIAGIGAYFLKRYLDNKHEEETQKAQQQANLYKAVQSSTSLTPTVTDVKKDIAINPSTQTFTKSEYLNLANKIYNNLNTNNLVGLVETFGKLKTNTDLKLLSVYFGVKVFKKDNILESYELKPLNLSQAITLLTPQLFQTKLNALLNAKKITYKLF